MTTTGFHGVFAAVPTPFDRDERLDVGRLSAACACWAASSSLLAPVSEATVAVLREVFVSFEEVTPV